MVIKVARLILHQTFNRHFVIFVIKKIKKDLTEDGKIVYNLITKVEKNIIELRGVETSATLVIH